MYIFRFLTFLLFLGASLNASIIVTEKGTLSDFTIPFFHDKNKTMDIDEISEINFSKTIPNPFSLGFIEGNVWLKFTITNNTHNNSVVLALSEAIYAHANLYVYKENDWLKYEEGVFADKHDYMFPTFEIDIAPNTSKTVYLELNSKIQFIGEFKLFPNKYLAYSDTMKSFIVHALFFGGLLIVMVYALFLFIRLKNILYLYYSAYVFVFSIFILGFSGFSSYLEMDEWIHLYNVFPSLTFTFFILFFMTLIDAKHKYPLIYKVMGITAIGFLLISMLILLDMKWFVLVNMFALVFYVELLFVGIYLVYKWEVEIMWYLAAILIYGVSAALLSLMFFDYLPYNDFTRYSIIYCSFFEIIFFSIMLTNRFYTMQQETITFQKSVIDLENTYQTNLKLEVDKKTLEAIALVEEKDVLLKEVYHRVKNNFQMVMCMIGLESFNIEEKKSREAFLKINNRLKSISLVHEYLYEAKSVSEINTQEYLVQIIEQIKLSYGKKRVIADDNIQFSSPNIDDMMVLGMLTNEIIHNAIKHHDKDTCHISIDLYDLEDDTMRFVIEDDGPGFNIALLEDSTGMGLHMIQDFVRRLLNGKVSVTTDNGTRYKVTFSKRN